MFKIVSHTRTGTHLLAKLIHSNFTTGLDDYEKLHFSHSRIPMNAEAAPLPYIHLWRPIYPVMLSIWRVREHLGIHKDVSFSTILRTVWSDMKRSESCETLFNGEQRNLVCPPRDFDDTLPDRWLKLTRYFREHAYIEFSYQDVVDRPWEVLRRIANRFSKWSARKTEFTPVLQRVGWYSTADEQPKITAADMKLLEGYEERFRNG
jgi:hypothetical protein